MVFCLKQSSIVNMLQYILVLLLLTGIFSEERPTIKTPDGTIRGVYRKTFTGRDYTAFIGIPYAEPPVGDLRFKAPVATKPWTGIWEADTEYICMHRNHDPLDNIEIFGNEDCLYINVFTPKRNNANTSLDVVVYIHGGGFTLGHGNQVKPSLIMDRDIVFVTFNYRLGPLGFLTTGDEASPGNYGLKDQNLALKWIKNNIAYFGGNPDSVTITGLSAGAASVHLHYLSPLSRNLFHRGISISGTALNNWALISTPLENARKLGTLVGCTQQNTNDLVACLKQKPSRQITQATKQLQPWLFNPFSLFGPSVEPKSPEAFLSKHPYELLQTGEVLDVPWISTVTKDEGLYPTTDFLPEGRLQHLEENWEKLAPYVLNYYGSVEKSSWIEVAQKVRKHYLDNKRICNDTLDGLVQAISDRLFVLDAEKATKLQAKVNKSPVYFSVFGYRGDHSITEVFARSTHNFGVSHADDIFFIFTPEAPIFSKYMESENDRKISKIIIDMWLSFAHTSKPELPSTEWKPVSKNTDDALNLLFIADSENLTMKEVKELGNKSFWNLLPIKENDKISILKDEL